MAVDIDASIVNHSFTILCQSQILKGYINICCANGTMQSKKFMNSCEHLDVVINKFASYRLSNSPRSRASLLELYWCISCNHDYNIIQLWRIPSYSTYGITNDLEFSFHLVVARNALFDASNISHRKKSTYVYIHFTTIYSICITLAAGLNSRVKLSRKCAVPVRSPG